MKKISMLSFILVFALLLAACGCAIAENAPLNDVPCQTVTLAEDDPDYFKELWAAELYNYKMIRNFTTMYEEAGWDAYRDKCVNLDRMDQRL